MSNANKKLALAEMSLVFGTGNSPYDVSIARLPDAVQFALMQRTFSHIMGNEAAAYEGRIKATEDEDGDAKYSATEVSVMVHDWRNAKLADMESGEFGLRAVGPRMSSNEKIMREFARDTIVTAAAVKKIVLPKASDREAWDSGIDRWLAIPANKAKAEAEVIARKARVVPSADEDVADLFAAA